MKLNKSVLVLPVAILISSLVSCNSAGLSHQLRSADRPQWLNSDPEMYPASAYLTATGTGSKNEDAKSRALGNLSKIIEVQVRDVSTTVNDVATFEQGGVETVTRNRRHDSQVNLKSETILQGARIAEQWQSSADLSYHALAVLDRKQAGNNLKGEMTRLDEQTDYLLQQQRQDPLLHISDLDKAVKHQMDRSKLQRTLKVIDPSGRGSPSSWNLTELNEQLAQALRALPVVSTVSRDDIGGLNNMLQAAVSSAGFKVAGNDANHSGYQIVATMDADPAFKQDNWYWMRGTLSLEFVSPQGKVLGHDSWPLKVSGSSESQLSSRMRQDVDNKLKEVLLDTMLEFAR